MGAVAAPATRNAGDTVAGRRAGDIGWYVTGVLVGAALIVTTAFRQPYSYDELTQIAPFGSNNLVEIVTATRQPPIDPLLGALFRHLFGQGQLQQRLVPVLAGIGILVLLSLLLRRLHLGLAGAFGVWVLATAPLMVRYSAYARPYALPLFFMLLFCYAVHRWLDERRPGWLVLAGGAAVALPLTRVPEPTVFLGVMAVTLGWFTVRGRFTWSQTLPVAAICLGVLFVLGVPMYLILAYTADNFLDTSPTGFFGRLGEGSAEIATAVVSLLAYWYSWWPVAAVALIATLAITASRRRLFSWLIWWPLLAGPVAFLLVYHYLNEYPFETLPYRARAAFFFLPAFVLLLVALATVVTDRAAGRWLRVGLAVLLVGVLVGQFRLTTTIVVANAAPDFGEVSAALTDDLPEDAIVLYGRPSPVGQTRQPFLGRPRYMGDTPFVATIENEPVDLQTFPRSGPVYVVINGQCARPGRCEASREPWDEQVPGFQLTHELERITIYEPARGQDGRRGVAQALAEFGATLGPEFGYPETFASASLYEQLGQPARGRALISRMYADAEPDVAEDIRVVADAEDIDPFG